MSSVKQVCSSGHAEHSGGLVPKQNSLTVGSRSCDTLCTFTCISDQPMRPPEILGKPFSCFISLVICCSFEFPAADLFQRTRRAQRNLQQPYSQSDIPQSRTHAASPFAIKGQPGPFLMWQLCTCSLSIPWASRVSAAPSGGVVLEIARASTGMLVLINASLQQGQTFNHNVFSSVKHSQLMCRHLLRCLPLSNKLSPLFFDNHPVAVVSQT